MEQTMDRNRKWVTGCRVMLLMIHMTLALEVPLDRKQFLLELFTRTHTHARLTLHVSVWFSILFSDSVQLFINYFLAFGAPTYLG